MNIDAASILIEFMEKIHELENFLSPKNCKNYQKWLFWSWRAEFCENQKKAWTFSYFYPREAIYQILENLAHQTCVFMRKCVSDGQTNGRDRNHIIGFPAVRILFMAKWSMALSKATCLPNFFLTDFLLFELIYVITFFFSVIYSFIYFVTSFPVESWASMPYEHMEKPIKTYILYESTKDTKCHIGHTF